MTLENANAIMICTGTTAYPTKVIDICLQLLFVQDNYLVAPIIIIIRI